MIDGATGCYIAGEFGNPGEIYHVGNDHEITIAKLISYISEILNIKINIITSDLREGGTPRRCPSIDKLKKIGYQPRYSSFQAVKRCVSWYVNNLSK